MTPGTWDAGTQGMTSVNPAAESDDPEVISRRIDHTRDAMAGTLDEIQRRLDPEQVSSYVKDVAYYVVLELKGAVRDLAGEAMTSVRSASPTSSAGAATRESPGAPHLTESTKALLSRYTGWQSSTKAGQGQMANQTQGLWQKLEANPIALGAVGLAVGSIVGAIAPRLHQEDQLMGEARDHLVENVQATAEQTVENLRTAAVETGSAVLKEATNQQQTM
ncbi:MAG: DUF3618 domain-containing protein [Chloroflexota bacterium]|nr:DUF3618 domain-containing protein [Chloroflexota bacterium]